MKKKKQQPEKKTMGRPPALSFKSKMVDGIETNEKLTILQGLCQIQCTLEEVAMTFKVSEDTIGRHIKKEFGETFAEYYKKYSVGGKISLRRIQYNHAKKNVSMAIWLGKQWLGQTDNKEIIMTTPIEGIEFIDDL